MLKKYLIAGGDLRYITLAEELSVENRVYTVGFDRNVISSNKVLTSESLVAFNERVDYIVLPLVASNDGITLNTPFSGQSIPLSGLTSVIKENGIVFGGRITDDIKDLFSERNIEVVDYSTREEFAVMNAVATGEGAVQVAMEETVSTLAEQKILIIGMGRIAKVMIRQLNGLCSNVTAAARKYHDLSWASIYGCKQAHINDLSEIISDFDIIFNTAPALVLDEKLLKRIKKGCLVIDLASKPGGIDFDTANKLGVRAIWLLSLPGKVAPVTSGRIIAKTIKNILSERSEVNGD